MVLARQLQALREKAGLSYEQAAEAIYASPWTMRRMERAEGGLKPLAVKRPAGFAGASAAEAGRLVRLRMLPDMVYGENMTGATTSAGPRKRAAYLQALDQISAQAAPPQHTAAILRDTRKEL